MLTNEQIKGMIESHTFYNNEESELMSLCRAIEQAARREALEDVAKWIEPQRNDIPACGFEFAAALRALITKEQP